MRRQFPSNLTAKMFGFKEYPYFEAPPDAKAVPKVELQQVTLKETVLAEFDHEMAVTRQLLDRLPEAAFAWKPHERSMSLGGLATHLAQIPHWGTSILQHDGYDLEGASARPAARTTLQGGSARDLRRAIRRGAPDARRAHGCGAGGALGAQERRASGDVAAARQRAAAVPAEPPRPSSRPADACTCGCRTCRCRRSTARRPTKACEPADCADLAAAAFGLAATANSGGYRYGVSDQAFYATAVVKDLHPAFFPRDTPLLSAESRLSCRTRSSPRLSRGHGVDLPPLFLGLYVAGLLALFVATWQFGRARRYSRHGASSALLILLTFRHRIAKTGANSLEGYMHPRMLAFACGVFALAALLRERHGRAAIWTIVGACWHPDDGVLVRVVLAVAVVVGAPAVATCRGGPRRHTGPARRLGSAVGSARGPADHHGCGMAEGACRKRTTCFRTNGRRTPGPSTRLPDRHAS